MSDVKAYCSECGADITGAGDYTREHTHKDCIAALQARIDELTMPEDMRETLIALVDETENKPILDWLQKGAK